MNGTNFSKHFDIGDKEDTRDTPNLKQSGDDYEGISKER